MCGGLLCAHDCGVFGPRDLSVPHDRKRFLAKVPLEPPFAMVGVSAAGMRLVFRLLVRARCR